MKTADAYTSPSRRFIAVCTLFLAIGLNAVAQENTEPLIPVETVPWDGIEKRLDDSEIVVLGLVDSVDARDPDDVSGGGHNPKNTLIQQLRKLRELGNDPIPGSGDKLRFSDRISILAVENIGKGDAAAVASHEQRARSMYRMMGAHPYVMSNPVIFLVHKGKLIRGYGVKIPQPGIRRSPSSGAGNRPAFPRSRRRNPAPGNRHDEGSRNASEAREPGSH